MENQIIDRLVGHTHTHTHTHFWTQNFSKLIRRKPATGARETILNFDGQLHTHTLLEGRGEKRTSKKFKDLSGPARNYITPRLSNPFTNLPRKNFTHVNGEN